jgi:hypothetical protein
MRLRQDLLQDQLAEEKRKIEELRAHSGAANDDELAQQMEESQLEIKALTDVCLYS